MVKHTQQTRFCDYKHLWTQFLSFETNRTPTITKKQFFILIRFLIESCGLMKLSLCLWWCLNTCKLTLREQNLWVTCSLLLLCLTLPCGQCGVSFSVLLQRNWGNANNVGKCSRISIYACFKFVVRRMDSEKVLTTDSCQRLWVLLWLRLLLFSIVSSGVSGLGPAEMTV